MKIYLDQPTDLTCMPVHPDDINQIGLEDGLVKMPAGELPITAKAFYEGAPASGQYYYVQLAESPVSGLSELGWFINVVDARLEGTEPDNNPVDGPVELPKTGPEEDFGRTIELPGISRPVGIYEPIYFEPERSHFTWAEFTKGGRRIPVDATVTIRLVKLAKYMDEVRAFLGNRPIKITSGYRDPRSNRAVGGALDSRHTYGDAVDFGVEGLDVVEVFYKLKGYHQHGGLAVGNGFVHLDLRPGAPARWTYPGGPQVTLW